MNQVIVRQVDLSIGYIRFLNTTYLSTRNV